MGTGSNSLVVDKLAIYDLGEERANGEATLIVDGNAGDSVTALGFTANGTQMVDGITCNLYEMGNTNVLVAQGITVTVTSGDGDGGGGGGGCAADLDPSFHDFVQDTMIHPDSAWLM